MSQPTCFISYSWDSEEQKEWVRGLAEHLQNNGVRTTLDQWDLKFGMNTMRFMEESIADADYVLMVCTPKYGERANGTTGGVGWEKQIITGEMYYQIAKETKFVPLLRHADQTTAIPRFLRGKYYVDFSDAAAYQANCDALLRHLHETPLHVKPGLGNAPMLSLTIAPVHLKTVSKFLAESFELSDIASEWELANKPYFIVENLQDRLKSVVRHPPEDAVTPSDPMRGFLLLAGLHHGGNWLHWVAENRCSPFAVSIILNTLKVTYERVRFRAFYALQFFDQAAVREAIVAPGFRISANVKDIIEQYVLTRQVTLYLHKTASSSDQQLADKVRAVIREIELCEIEPPGR